MSPTQKKGVLSDRKENITFVKTKDHLETLRNPWFQVFNLRKSSNVFAVFV